MTQLPTTNRAPPEPLLDVHNLCRSYGSVQALRDVSLSLMPGTIGLVGNNGAGKSTLLKVLLGLLAPDSGGGTILGYDFSDWTDDDWHDSENLSALRDLSGHLTGTPAKSSGPAARTTSATCQESASPRRSFWDRRNRKARILSAIDRLRNRECELNHSVEHDDDCEQNVYRQRW